MVNSGLKGLSVCKLGRILILVIRVTCIWGNAVQYTYLWAKYANQEKKGLPPITLYITAALVRTNPADTTCLLNVGVTLVHG